MSEQASGFTNLRAMCREFLDQANVDSNLLESIRASIDQMIAEARDAGLGPEQTGAAVLYALNVTDVKDPQSQLVELVNPGWHQLVSLAILMEVFDDRRDDVTSGDHT